VPLLHPLDRPSSLTAADAGHRALVFVDAYGMSKLDRWWDDGVTEPMPRTEA
jgi:hypothetical protein